MELDDENRWPKWPDSLDPKEYTEKLSDSLESNDFSNVKLDDLPIAADQLSRAARRSPDEILGEALGFSIMSRNPSLMEDLLRKGDNHNRAGLYPFHLAVSYLDGAKACCTILNVLTAYISPALPKLSVNDLGHTILDQFMIAILKAHSSCLPSVVDVMFKKDKDFEGAEVDICGR